MKENKQLECRDNKKAKYKFKKRQILHEQREYKLRRKKEQESKDKVGTIRWQQNKKRIKKRSHDVLLPCLN